MKHEHTKTTTTPTDKQTATNSLDTPIVQTELDYDGVASTETTAEVSQENATGGSLDCNGLGTTPPGHLSQEPESCLVGSRLVLLRGRPYNCVVTPWFEEFPDDHDFWKQVVNATFTSSDLILGSTAKPHHDGDPTSLVFAPRLSDHQPTVGMLIEVKSEDGYFYWLRRGLVLVAADGDDKVVKVLQAISDDLEIPVNGGDAEEIRKTLLGATEQRDLGTLEADVIEKALVSLEAGHLYPWQMDAICALSPIGIGGRVQYFGYFDLMLRLMTLVNTLRAQQNLASKQASPPKTAASLPERSEILERFVTLPESRRQEAIRKVNAMYDDNKDKDKELIKWLVKLPVPKKQAKIHTRSELGRLLTSVRAELNRVHPGTPELIESFVEMLANDHARVGPKHSLLLDGPPGIGKTTIVSNYARSVVREFRKIDLGGLTDPQELLGFHATYRDSRPGRIISALAGCETANPIILLDEIDKTGTHEGAVADVLLALLDPGNLGVFVDGYLDLPYDLSGVTWVATSNSSERIPRALLDRLHVIKLSGYSDQQKFTIACEVLLPEILRGYQHDLRNGINVSETVIERLIELNSGDPGLRTLQRWLQSLVTKLLVADLEGIELVLTPGNATSLLGLDNQVTTERNAPGSYL
ncbi:AAA family ATPase [Ferrimicrobium acidiphilum]|uniref:AAA family ATPase n=1 Tax=Ferrimicrobium acidiphilum TaxID=121039 RepID=A0ABV3Y6I1_9ACTN